MTTLAPAAYRDRRTGLTVFGVFEILMGGFFLLMLGAMAVSLLVLGRSSGLDVSPRTAVPGMLFYALLAGVCIWLGIGSLLARRWARALWVCLSGISLGIGILTIPVMVWFTARGDAFRARPGAPALPPEARTVAIAMVIFFMFLFYLFIPGTLFLFYRSSHVKRTCEVRDPVERWTDRCPLPVLALSLFALVAALGTLPLLLFNGVFPFFGAIISGLPGDGLVLLLAGLWFYIAWSLYHVRMRGWWLALVATLVVAISGAVTFAHVDLATLYRQMGFDERLTAVASAADLGAFKWTGMVSLVPWLGWLFVIRRYFAPKVSTAVGDMRRPGGVA